MDELAKQINATLARQTWAYIFLAVGLIIVLITLIYGISDAVGYTDYFSYTKAERDAAAAGSSLLALERDLESTEPWTKPLAFMGMAYLFFGIGLMLASIKYRAQMRGKVLAYVVPLVVRRSK